MGSRSGRWLSLVRLGLLVCRRGPTVETLTVVLLMMLSMLRALHVMTMIYADDNNDRGTIAWLSF